MNEQVILTVGVIFTAAVTEKVRQVTGNPDFNEQVFERPYRCEQSEVGVMVSTRPLGQPVDTLGDTQVVSYTFPWHVIDRLKVVTDVVPITETSDDAPRNQDLLLDSYHVDRAARELAEDEADRETREAYEDEQE